MKILILSGNTGGGHNSCANALLERFGENHITEIRDCLSFISPAVSKIVSTGHTVAYRYTPALFNIGYNYFEKHSGVYSGGSLIKKLFLTGGKKLAAYINENNFDIVICTHAFAAFMLKCATEHLTRSVETAFVATDFTCSPTAENGNPDLLFIPHEQLIDEFSARGLDSDKMVACGIPVRKAFYKFCDKAAAKRELGINTEHRHILIMCGSMGCGPITRFSISLARKVDSDTEITVICGNNKSLKRRLEIAHRRHKNVHICGFTKNISLYMDSADVYITKPGGISISEGAVKKTPMVLLPSVGGCENYNIDFFTRNKAAVSGKDRAKIAKCCIQLLNNEEQRKQLTDNLSKLEIDNATNIIFDTLTK